MSAGVIDGESSGDYSGWTVALSFDGLTLAVGAIFAVGPNWPIPAESDAGHVRVFTYNGTAWNQKGEDIDGWHIKEKSGFSLAISADGGIVAIGSLNGNDPVLGGNGYVSRLGGWPGTVKVRQWVDESWIKMGTDEIDMIGNCFTQHRSCLGSTLSMSANGKVIATSDLFRGIISVYEYDTGEEKWTLNDANTIYQVDPVPDTPEEITDAGRFGYKVVLSGDGNTIVTSNHMSTSNKDSSQRLYSEKVVQVYKRTGVAWSLISDDGVATNFCRFQYANCDGGYYAELAVSLDGNTIAIGEHQGYYKYGSVRVLRYTESGWQRMGGLITGAIRGANAATVALSADGEVLAVGAASDFNNLFPAVRQGYRLDHGVLQDGYASALGTKSLAWPTQAYTGSVGYARVYAWKESTGEWKHLQSSDYPHPKSDTLGDYFGHAVALSGDGKTLAVGAPQSLQIGYTARGQTFTFARVDDAPP